MVHFFMGRLPATTGGETYNVECIQALREAGYTVHYHWVSPYRSASILGLLPRVGGILSAFFVALFFAWRKGLFIVDQEFLEPLWLTNVLRRCFRRGPLIVMVHHLKPVDYSKAMQKMLFGEPDKILVVSQYTHNDVLSLGINVSKLTVVAPGYRAKSSGGVERSLTGPLRCLVVGRCEPRKDWNTVLRAVAEFKPQDLQVTFVGSLAGDTFSSQVEPQFKTLGLGNRVRFLGAVSEEVLTECYQSHHILIHPSIQEGFGIVVLEAYHHGLAVVGSDTTSIPELVEPEQTGLLFPPGDDAALAQVLQRLLEDRELVHRLGANGMAVAEEYSWERTRQKFLKAVSPFLESKLARMSSL